VIKISESQGVDIYAYEQGFFSFTNSPYFAHKKALAIDIYPPRGNKEALSPVEGKIILIKPISSGMDYVTIIEPTGKENICVKILHVKPSLKVGESIKPGDFFGKIVWSPFYNFWTDYHLHIEVRPASDPLRASGGFEIDMTPIIKRMISSYTQRKKNNNLTFKVKSVKENYVLLNGTFIQTHYSSPFMVKRGDFIGCLDGGIPHYGHGALIGEGGLPNNERLTIFGIRTYLDYYTDNYIHFSYEKRRILVNGEIYRGMSFYINDECLKLIPLKLGKTNLNEGEEVIIRPY